MTKIITTLHDPSNVFSPLIEQVKELFMELAPNLVIACTETTNTNIINYISSYGALTMEGGLWGQSRRKALAYTLDQTQAQNFFVCDFDKIIHWLKVAPEELSNLLKEGVSVGEFRILGRDAKTFATYPNSWLATESKINKMVSQLIKLDVDILAATFLFDWDIAQSIVSQSQEESWGACVEWPLIAFSTGKKMSCKNAQGLTFEDPDRCQEDIQRAGGYENWLENRFDNPTEWAKRFGASLEQTKVVERFWNE